ncbi:MAG TPA: ATP-binding SpoIIE family protein phosphatase, partial [Terriglobia bacterium]|nr:ATP-binding SpoIIE family protein phosphatase [Terriglobia bacterium]
MQRQKAGDSSASPSYPAEATGLAMSDQFILRVTEASQVSEVRRTVAAAASKAGFTEVEIGKLSLVATEAATNLVKHAVAGEILVRPLAIQGRHAIEILALDKGPGIADIAESLRDGHSTAASSGTGMGAMSRLSSLFDLYSMPGGGTALLAQVWSGGDQQESSSDSLEIGVVCLPKDRQGACGDGWNVSQQGDRSLLLVVDGLGHGPEAALAAQEAIRIFQKSSHLTPAAIVELAHAGLRSTRGAVLGVAEVDGFHQAVKFSGVGNIASAILSPGKSRHLVSVNGTVGHSVRKIQEFTYPW